MSCVPVILQAASLLAALTHLRIYVEAAIDFPDEEIDFLSDGKIEAQLNSVMTDLDAVRAEARQGSLLREGMKVVIAGRPNAGKSSLLNALAGREAAIVTDIAGTTRDVLREHIHIDGMPLHIIDTAGLRDASDEVERIGIERAWQEIEQADRVLFMVDGTTTDAVDPAEIWPDFIARLPAKLPITVVRNKADKTGETLGLSVNGEQRQQGSTADMIHKIVPLIAYMSKFFTLKASPFSQETTVAHSLIMASPR